MMVRFSCFHAQNHSHKPEKRVLNSSGTMQKSPASKEGILEDFTNPCGENSVHLMLQVDGNSGDDFGSSSSLEHDLKSEGSKNGHNFESDLGVNWIGCMKKSLSLGSALNRNGNISSGSDSESEMDKERSCHRPIYSDMSVIAVSNKETLSALPHHSEEGPSSDSVQLNSDVANPESVYSQGYQQPSDKEVNMCLDTMFLRDVPHSSAVIHKSKSLPNIVSSTHHPTSACVMSRSKSHEDLNISVRRCEETIIHEVGKEVIEGPGRYHRVFIQDENNFENNANRSCNSDRFVGSAGNGTFPGDVVGMSAKDLPTEPSLCAWDELKDEDFKMKRIEDWVMNIQERSSLEDIDESFSYDKHMQDNDSMLDSSSAVVKSQEQFFPTMEAAKKCVSSLSASATTVQLANHGLALTPFLNCFVNLRAINLAGNSIVRISAGALPRGVHVLNLSKNHISTIEGLRDLTRLRVLDLTCNRIFRIGHGLASCTSLKELYLAGNKISEVEGLHRLLKLNVLDLRVNKISTTKCLGQLAANYNSLQVIRLEENPAQKNIGDEQLKKYLQGLLPRLAYYNTLPIKGGILKDLSDRSGRLGIGSHQIERGLRSDRKSMHKGSQHGHKVQAAASRCISRSKRVNMAPPIRTKPFTRQHNINDLSSKVAALKVDLSMRRSRSEGTLGVF